VSVDVGIIGIVRSYGDTNLDLDGTTKTSFIVGRSAYYLVSINSDINLPLDANGNPSPDLYQPTGTGTVMSFSQIQLVGVTLAPSVGNVVQIFSNGSAVNFTALGLTNYQTNCKVLTTKGPSNTPLQQNQVGFTFVFTRAVVSSLAKDQELSVSVIVDVEVFYSNATKKRFSLQSTGSDANAYNVNNTIVDDGSGPTATTDVVTAFTTEPDLTTTDKSDAIRSIIAVILIFVSLMIHVNQT